MQIVCLDHDLPLEHGHAGFRISWLTLESSDVHVLYCALEDNKYSFLSWREADHVCYVYMATGKVHVCYVVILEG